MCRGAYFSLSEPTAETERMRSTPSVFRAKMLARKLQLAGRGCGGRARGGAGRPRVRPSSVPSTRRSEGGPNGVSTATSRAPVKPVHLVEAAAADDADLGRRLAQATDLQDVAVAFARARVRAACGRHDRRGCASGPPPPPPGAAAWPPGWPPGRGRSPSRRAAAGGWRWAGGRWARRASRPPRSTTTI